MSLESRRPTEDLFGSIFGRGASSEQVSGAAWLQAMLDAEGALAYACASCDLIPTAAAEAIEAKCQGKLYDLNALSAAAADRVSPVPPVVAALRDKVGGKYAEYVHRGAADQDILDTAAMLVAKRALAPLEDDLLALRSALGALADEHRLTPMIGRVRMRQTQPTTFGLKAAGWFSAVSDAAYDLVVAEDSGLLAAQLGGVGGTLAAFGDRGLEVAEQFAGRLELNDPFLPWHTARNRPADLAAAIGVLSGVLSKIALDVTLMSQSEIGELREARSGEPAATAVTAIGKRTPGLVASVLGAMAQEHEGAAGAWQSEWETISELLRLGGAQVAWARELIDGLDVQTERMAVNLEAALIAMGGNLDEIDIGNAPALVERLLAETLSDERDEHGEHDH